MSADKPASRVRSIDASMRNLAVESVRAIGGLVVAFSVAWWSSDGLGLRNGIGGYVASTAIFLVAGLIALTCTSGLPIYRALAAQRTEILNQQEQLRATAEGHRFTAELHSALEMAADERDLLHVVGRALDLVSGGPGELLLADTSRSHVAQEAASVASGSPGCAVGAPSGCPAMRTGQTFEFTDSRDLASCPHLRGRPHDVAALCVPVAILGVTAGVYHLTGPVGSALDPAVRHRTEVLATQTGTRLGLLRTMATTELAASTDSLTGRLNRRSVEAELRRLDQEGTPYAVAFADLDNFKILNDTHGHATGDRALRHFATISNVATRTGDMVCRFGGEEFLLAYLSCDVTEAAPIVHRLRSALAASMSAADVPAFTVSFGLADSTYAPTAAEVIACADSALLTAKREGRDRLIIAEKPDPSTESALIGL